jgi:hypothetical protein
VVRDRFFDSTLRGALRRLLAIGRVVVPLWLGLLGLQWLPMGEAGRYAQKYHVSKDRVMIQKKPANCDWGTAPLGKKNCHFVKHIDPIKDEQGRVTEVAVYWVGEED